MNDFNIAQVSQSTSSPVTTGKTVEGLDTGWVPLFQTLSWILFWLILIHFIYRNFNSQLGGLLNAFVNRVQQGSPVEAGNFKLGAPPALATQQVNTATTEGIKGIDVSENLNEKVLNYQKYSTGVAEEIFLLHEAEVVRSPIENKRGKYRVRIWLESYPEVDFNEFSQVIYRLHETFPQQIIATAANKNQFELWLNVWGEFTVIAYVERKDKESLWLTRYLDLPGR